MLRNFHLTALAEVNGELKLLHIPLHQDLQNRLTNEWTRQLETFLTQTDEVDFDAGYTPDMHERFRLNDFHLPVEFDGIQSTTIGNLETFNRDEAELESIKALVSFCRDRENREIILFQNFNRSHLIEPGKFIFLREDVYQTMDRPALVLEEKLSAVYFPQHQKLLFRSFRIANTFLPLGEFYEEASEEQIREVLEHPMLLAEDVEKLAVGASQWFRKRFAMLRDSGVLDEFSVRQIRTRSRNYDVNIRAREGKIVFPSEKLAAKRLLQFLNEEIFRGAITETLYETNSKKEAGR